MIHVIASIHIKEGRVPEFIEIFKANIPAVLAEKGCQGYMPTLDVPTGLPPQEVNPCVVTILEKWSSPDALKDHLSAPHMKAYHQKVKEIVDKVTIKVLEEI